METGEKTLSSRSGTPSLGIAGAAKVSPRAPFLLRLRGAREHRGGVGHRAKAGVSPLQGNGRVATRGPTRPRPYLVVALPRRLAQWLPRLSSWAMIFSLSAGSADWAILPPSAWIISTVAFRSSKRRWSNFVRGTDKERSVTQFNKQGIPPLPPQSQALKKDCPPRPARFAELIFPFQGWLREPPSSCPPGGCFGLSSITTRGVPDLTSGVTALPQRWLHVTPRGVGGCHAAREGHAPSPHPGYTPRRPLFQALALGIQRNP